MHIKFDDRGREILSEIPASFTLPTPRPISTLDFHRQRLLEQREAIRRMMEEMKENEEYETFAEANDFRVEDPFDEAAAYTDFELDDDGLDGVEAVAREEYRRAVANASSEAGKETVASTETQSRPESGS